MEAPKSEKKKLPLIVRLAGLLLIIVLFGSIIFFLISYIFQFTSSSAAELTKDKYSDKQRDSVQVKLENFSNKLKNLSPAPPLKLSFEEANISLALLSSWADNLLKDPKTIVEGNSLQLNESVTGNQSNKDASFWLNWAKSIIFKPFTDDTVRNNQLKIQFTSTAWGPLGWDRYFKEEFIFYVHLTPDNKKPFRLTYNGKNISEQLPLESLPSIDAYSQLKRIEFEKDTITITPKPYSLRLRQNLKDDLILSKGGSLTKNKIDSSDFKERWEKFYQRAKRGYQNNEIKLSANDLNNLYRETCKPDENYLVYIKKIADRTITADFKLPLKQIEGLNGYYLKMMDTSVQLFEDSTRIGINFNPHPSLMLPAGFHEELQKTDLLKVLIKIPREATDYLKAKIVDDQVILESFGKVQIAK